MADEIYCPFCKAPAKPDVSEKDGKIYVACDDGSCTEYYDDAIPYTCGANSTHVFYIGIER